ncbi:MAG: hypothetical protein ACYC6Y_25650 [Thermoguttaceae bacterium]
MGLAAVEPFTLPATIGSRPSQLERQLAPAGGPAALLAPHYTDNLGNRLKLNIP